MGRYACAAHTSSFTKPYTTGHTARLSSGRADRDTPMITSISQVVSINAVTASGA